MSENYGGGNLFCFICSMEEMNLELITKLPEGKPPYIGIVFEESWKGESLNKIWPETYGKDWYQLRFEVKRDYLELTLKSNIADRCKYQIQNFNLSKLRFFIEQTRNIPQINFGHLTIWKGQYRQLRTSVNQARWLLGVNKIEFVAEH